LVVENQLGGAKREQEERFKMKTTSLKTIYLKEHELKQAIVEYLEKEHEDLAQHLYDNECEMVWKSEYFVISIDGETDEKDYSVDINMAAQKEINKMVDQVKSAAVKAAHKVMEQHGEAFEKLAENEE